MKPNLLGPVAACLTVLLMAACARTPVVQQTSIAAQAAIDRLLLLNQGLIDLKGIGQMKLVRSNQSTSARMAWAGTFPDKLRMDILGSPGVKLVTLASNGEYVYLKLYQENRFYKKNNEKALFKGIVNIPITVREVVQILGGKIPIAPHRSAVLKDIDSDQAVLEFIDRWGNACQRVFLSSNQGRPTGFEMLKTDGTVSYRTEFAAMMDLERFKVPKYLVLSNSKGDRFELEVEKYWVNQPLPLSRFSLHP
jgi:outer membrane biogenesis lipoprotein LolB